MSESFDPRFDPRFQRGADGAPASIPTRPANARDEPVSRPVDAPLGLALARRATRRWLGALWAVVLGSLVIGIASIVGAIAISSGGSGIWPLRLQVLQQVLWLLGPVLVIAGVLGVLVACAAQALRWSLVRGDEDSR